MNWYIGQEVVCIKSHCDGFVKEGKTYRISGISHGQCVHERGIIIDVGVKCTWFSYGCPICCKVIDYNTMWFCETLFAPLMDISELQELAKKETQKA